MPTPSESPAGRLAEIRAALATGNPNVIHDIAQRWASEGAHEYAALSRLMLAAQRHDDTELDVQAQKIPRLWLAADPWLFYALVDSVYLVRGITSATPYMRSPRPDVARLPRCWQENLLQIERFLTLMRRSDRHTSPTAPGEIPLLRAQALCVCHVALNGGVRGALILDTGAPTSVLDMRYARDSGVTYDVTAALHGRSAGGGEFVVYPGVVERLTIGRVELHNVPVHVAELSPDLHVQGILAPLEMFRGWDVHIDVDAGRLRILRAEADAVSDEPGLHRAGLVWSNGNPSVAVRVDGRHGGHFLVDTGAGANLICSSFARHALDWPLAEAAAMHSATAAGAVGIRRGGPATIMVADDVVPATAALVTECHDDPETLFPSMTDGFLGLPWFQGKQVTFPANRRTMNFRLAPAEP